MRFILLLLIGVVGIVFFFINDDSQRNKARTELEKTKLVFSGVLTNVKEAHGFNGYGIIELRILNSNVKEYDPRDTAPFYYCVIKNSVAEVYDHAFNTMIGDTLIINTAKSLHCIGGKWNDSTSGTIHVSQNKAYYDFVRENTIFEKSAKAANTGLVK